MAQKCHLTKLSYFRRARQLKFFISMPLFTELISHESFVAEVQHKIYVEQLCLTDENVEIFLCCE